MFTDRKVCTNTRLDYVIQTMLPLVDKFRTMDWKKIEKEIQFSKIFEMFSIVVLQK